MKVMLAMKVKLAMKAKKKQINARIFKPASNKKLNLSNKLNNNFQTSNKQWKPSPIATPYSRILGSTTR